MPVIDGLEWLVINGVPLYTPAWKITDHTPLMQAAATVGTNKRLPGGRMLTFPRYRTQSELDLPMVIFGDVNSDGVAYSESRGGLVVNIDYLNTYVVTENLPGDGCHAATWNNTIGQRTARVQAALSLGERKGFACRATLVLTIPAGRFV
jgi:hypothetical protein